MLNLTVGDLLVYSIMIVFLMAILGLGTTLLSRLGKRKLAVLAFSLLVGVIAGAINLIIFHSPQLSSGFRSGLEIRCVSVSALISLLLLVAGSTLVYDERLKRVGLALEAIGAIIGVGAAIYLLWLLA